MNVDLSDEIDPVWWKRTRRSLWSYCSRDGRS